ncbi:Major facilitator superfamily protein [Mycena indigotica]|uniref:Major facilitator superfamily protein n=1 Tax=Mycena indigotica TaxID=2126181 RepID=A0A8H6SG03_9AGAR|nr:Major facilitator superfamily protein [Mycena indigotica]KAF7298821.1 Major facilitator superfamily protein [Mycena indigotica]
METSTTPSNVVEGEQPTQNLNMTILTGRRLAVAFTAMLLSVLVMALDQTILATALPRIASDFDAFTLQGWVSTSFLLAQAVFLLPYGQLLRIFSAKWMLFISIVIFQLGSLVCGVGQNMNHLIAGRTVSGLGAAGIWVAMFQVMYQVTRLEDRPRLFGIFGAVFQISVVLGSIIGGAFTSNLSWRWCFFINLPVGFVSLVGVFFLLESSPPIGADPTKRSWPDLLRQVSEMDFIGVLLISSALTTLVLALQWGGNQKPWNDKAVIICLVLAVLLTAALIVWEKRLGDKAMSPTAIFHSLSIYAMMLYTFLLRFCFLLFSFYIPIYYQAAREHSAIKSGVDLLPFLIGVSVAILGAAQIISWMKFYWHLLVLSPIFVAVGSGLIVGLGVGTGMQTALLALQFEFNSPKTIQLIGQATSLATLFQLLGGTIGLAVATPVLSSTLSTNINTNAPAAPADIVSIIRDSPTSIYTDQRVPSALIPGIVRAYTGSLKVVFVLGVPVAGLALLSAMFMHRIRIGEQGPLEETDIQAKDEEVGVEEDKPGG